MYIFLTLELILQSSAIFIFKVGAYLLQVTVSSTVH